MSRCKKVKGLIHNEYPSEGEGGIWENVIEAGVVALFFVTLFIILLVS